MVSQARLLRQRRARCRASRAAGASPLPKVRVGRAWRFQERALPVGNKTSRAGRHGGGSLCADIVQPPPGLGTRATHRRRRHGPGALGIWVAGSWSCVRLPLLSGAAQQPNPQPGPARGRRLHGMRVIGHRDNLGLFRRARGWKCPRTKQLAARLRHLLRRTATS